MSLQELTRSRILVLQAALAVLALVAAWAVLSGRGAPSADAQGVDPEVRSTMSVFARDRTIEDDRPGNAAADQRQLDAIGESQPGEDLTQSRRADPPNGPPVYLWPMKKGVCHSAGGCVAIRIIQRRGVAVSTEFTLRRDDLKFEDVRVVGLARDGIDSVEVRFRDGTGIETRVVENVFQLVGLEDRPVEVRWHDQAGRHSEPIGELDADDLGSLRRGSP